jgi:hypothetical protein
MPKGMVAIDVKVRRRRAGGIISEQLGPVRFEGHLLLRPAQQVHP